MRCSHSLLWKMQLSAAKLQCYQATSRKQQQNHGKCVPNVHALSKHCQCQITSRSRAALLHALEHLQKAHMPWVNIFNLMPLSRSVTLVHVHVCKRMRPGCAVNKYAPQHDIHYKNISAAAAKEADREACASVRARRTAPVQNDTTTPSVVCFGQFMCAQPVWRCIHVMIANQTGTPRERAARARDHANARCSVRISKETNKPIQPCLVDGRRQLLIGPP